MPRRFLTGWRREHSLSLRVVGTSVNVPTRIHVSSEPLRETTAGLKLDVSLCCRRLVWAEFSVSLVCVDALRQAEHRNLPQGQNCQNYPVWLGPQLFVWYLVGCDGNWTFCSSSSSQSDTWRHIDLDPIVKWKHRFISPPLLRHAFILKHACHRFSVNRLFQFKWTVDEVVFPLTSWFCDWSTLRLPSWHTWWRSAPLYGFITARETFHIMRWHFIHRFNKISISAALTWHLVRSFQDLSLNSEQWREVEPSSCKRVWSLCWTFCIFSFVSLKCHNRVTFLFLLLRSSWTKPPVCWLRSCE